MGGIFQVPPNPVDPHNGLYCDACSDNSRVSCRLMGKCFRLLAATQSEPTQEKIQPPSWEVLSKITGPEAEEKPSPLRVLHKGVELTGVDSVMIRTEKDGTTTLVLEVALPSDSSVRLKGEAHNWKGAAKP